jgi:hypothetical protein
VCEDQDLPSGRLKRDDIRVHLFVDEQWNICRGSPVEVGIRRAVDRLIWAVTMLPCYRGEPIQPRLPRRSSTGTVNVHTILCSTHTTILSCRRSRALQTLLILPCVVILATAKTREDPLPSARSRRHTSLSNGQVQGEQPV